MKVSNVDSRPRVGFAAKKTASKGLKNNSSCNFKGNNSVGIGVAITGAAIFAGVLMYLGLSSKNKTARTISSGDSFQSQSFKPTTMKNNKVIDLARPSNKRYQEYLKKQASLA